jgi:hypothetical protein
LPVETTSYFDAAGIQTVLSAQPRSEVIKGMLGRGSMPIGFVEDEVPDLPGAVIRRIKKLVRVVGVPMLFSGGSKDVIRADLAALAAKLDPARGAGRLRILRVDGSLRELNCYYSGGLEGDESAGGPTHQLAVISFRAEDPYWYDPATVTVVYNSGGAGAFFPIFPLRLGTSQVFTGAIENNLGDVEAWPIWTITGPGDTLVLTNNTTGETLHLNYALLTGESLVIDTRPGHKTVVKNDGTNLFGFLDFGGVTSALWSLARGNNDLTIELSGINPAVTRVQLSYQRRYQAA